MDYEARFTWVDGGRLRDRADAYGAVIPLDQLPALIGSWEQVLLAAADAAGWHHEKVRARGECIEVTLPDGSRLTRPEQTFLRVGPSRCRAHGMATICETTVTLVVPPRARNQHARCKPPPPQTSTHSPTTMSHAPMMSLAEDVIVGAGWVQTNVRSALQRLRERLGNWDAVYAKLHIDNRIVRAILSEDRIADKRFIAALARALGWSAAEVVGTRPPPIPKTARPRKIPVQPIVSKGQLLAALEETGGDVEAAGKLLGLHKKQIEAYGPPPPSAQRLRELLVAHDGNVNAVARELGKDHKQVRRWLRYLDIDASEYVRLAR